MPYSVPKPHVIFLDQIPVPLALVDTAFQVVGTSPSWLDKFSFERQDVEGRSLFELFPYLSEDWFSKLNYVRDGLENVQIIHQAHDSSNDDDKYIWELNPWRDETGANQGIIVTVKDWSATGSLEFELQKTRNLLRQKGKIAKIGSWEYRVESDEILLSPTVRDIFKIKETGPLNLEQSFKLYKKGHSRAQIKKVVEQALKNGLPWNENFELASPSEGSIWINLIGRPKFTNESCTRIIGTIQDITERIDSETRIPHKEKNVRFRSIFDGSPTPTAVIDFDSGKISNVNESMSKLAGRSAESLVNKSLWELGSFSVLDRLSILYQLRENDRFLINECRYTLKDHTVLQFKLQGKVHTMAKGKKIIICTCEDTAYHRKKNGGLRSELELVNQHNENLVSFTHMVCHNLKAHSVNFSHLFDFLSVETNPSRKGKMISVLKDSNRSLSDSIQGLREIVAIRENTGLPKEQLPMNDFIYRTEQHLMGLIRKMNAKIINEIPDDATVMALAPYLENILLNVLSNALKFQRPNNTPVVVFSIKIEEPYTIVSVEDNGQGMDLSKNRSKLFKPYSTLGNNINSKGTGLYLTKYQIELMNGKIEVESTAGKGSIFKLFFLNRVTGNDPSSFTAQKAEVRV